MPKPPAFCSSSATAASGVTPTRPRKPQKPQPPQEELLLPLPAVPEAGVGPITMTSLEIAELTGKRHTNVLRDVTSMLTELKTEPSEFLETYKDPTGRLMPCYKLPWEETITLIAGYSHTLRRKIIRRWKELEDQLAGKRQPVVSMPDLSDPHVLQKLLIEQTTKHIELKARMEELEKRETHGTVDSWRARRGHSGGEGGAEQCVWQYGGMMSARGCPLVCIGSHPTPTGGKARRRCHVAYL